MSHNEIERREFWDAIKISEEDGLIYKYRRIITNPRIGAVSQIEEKVCDVGEYELLLTLKLKK